MSESFWEPGSTEQPHTEARPEFQSETHQQEPAAAPGTLALSAADFKSLEERILRTVDIVKRESWPAPPLKNAPSRPKPNCTSTGRGLSNWKRNCTRSRMSANMCANASNVCWPNSTHSSSKANHGGRDGAGTIRQGNRIRHG